jgi:hypothetical protein
LHDGAILVTTDEPDHKKWIRGHDGFAVESQPYHSHDAEEVVERHYERLALVSEEAERIWPRGLARFLGDVVQAINDSWYRGGR